MKNLAQMLEWKYGPVASTAAIVMVSFDKIHEEKEESIVFSIDKKDANGKKAGSLKPNILKEDIRDKQKQGGLICISMLQKHADKYGLEYDSEKTAMVITGWKSDKKEPDNKQLEKDFKEYEAHLASKEYELKRADEYPPIEDQLDAIFKGGPDFDAMKSKIDAVKKKHPKS